MKLHHCAGTHATSGCQAARLCRVNPGRRLKHAVAASRAEHGAQRVGGRGPRAREHGAQEAAGGRALGGHAAARQRGRLLHRVPRLRTAPAATPGLAA